MPAYTAYTAYTARRKTNVFWHKASFWVFVLVALIFSNDAIAQERARTIGDSILQIFSNAEPFQALIVMVCFLGGIYLLGTGLFSFARSVSDRQRGYGDAARRLGMAAFVAAIPASLGVGLNTLWGGSGNTFGFLSGGAPLAGQPANCIQAFTQGGGLACVANNIARNVAPPAVFVSVFVAFLAGVGILGKSFYDLAVAKSDGRPVNTQGITGRVIAGLLLANLPLLAGSMLNTLGGTNLSALTGSGTIIESRLTYVEDGRNLIVQNFNSLMNSIFIIMVMFGTFAIIRGIVIMKQVSENKAQGKTMGSAVTHLVAGALMMNMNWTICTFSSTFIGRSQFLSFCSF